MPHLPLRHVLAMALAAALPVAAQQPARRTATAPDPRAEARAILQQV